MASLVAALFLSALALGDAQARDAPLGAVTPLAGAAEAPPPLRPLRPRPGLIPQDVQGRPAVPIEVPSLAPEVRPPLAAPLPPPNPVRPPPPPTHPVPAATCDPGGCWDSGGVRYNGSGPTLFRSDGKVCQQIGNMLHCN